MPIAFWLGAAAQTVAGDRASTVAELRALMLRNGPIAARRATAFWIGVRAGGWATWLGHAPESVAQARRLCRLLP
jgi:hypothetical protein